MQKFISPYVYNLILDNNIGYDDSYESRKLNLFSKFMITSDRLDKYGNSLYLIHNIEDLKKEISILDLIIYCSFKNINLLHIKNVRDVDELYCILAMTILIADSFRKVLLDDITNNLYLQKLIYLALDTKYWIKKSIEQLYREIISGKINSRDDIYRSTYKSIKDSYNNYRCSSHKFVVKREIYMMLDKNLYINFLEGQVKSNPTSDMFDECYINGDNDEVYNSMDYIDNGYLFHNRLQMFTTEEPFFYMRDGNIFYGDDIATEESIIEGRDKGYLLKDLYVNFGELINNKFTEVYNSTSGEHITDLKDYLSITDEYYLLYRYKYLSRESKLLLSLMLVDDYYLLKYYIKEGHKNILRYTRKWLNRL